MRQDIEDAVEKYGKDHSILNYKGAAESSLRFWGYHHFYGNQFRNTKNSSLYKLYKEYDIRACNYNSSFSDGREHIAENPWAACHAIDGLRYARFEMWRRGIVDGVYDHWGEDEDEILKRIENMPEIDSPDFKYIDGRDKDGKRIKS